MTLSRKRRAFIDEYLRDFNASQAAIRAGYSERTSRQIASRLLKNPEIAEEIERRMDELSMSAEEAILRMSDLARGDLGDFFTFIDGIKEPYLDLEKAKKAGKLHHIKKLIRGADGKLTIELHDPKDAQKEILKVRGAYAPNKHELDVGGDIIVNLSWGDDDND